MPYLGPPFTLKHEIEISVEARAGLSESSVRLALGKALNLHGAYEGPFHTVKRSLDARQVPEVFRLRVVLENVPAAPSPHRVSESVGRPAQEPVLVVGAGPAGLFAAYRLAQQGHKVVVVEQGKDVRARRRDLAQLNRSGEVNPYSNYCFGEGGAGTYSDGKLYTRSKKRGSVETILNVLVAHGAHPDILVNAHPHIGTNHLPAVVTGIRMQVEEWGGEVRFGTALTDWECAADGTIRIAHLTEVDSGKTTSLALSALVLATGHSARSIYHLLYRKQLMLEAKPFALGVRIEHPQEAIDRTLYHCRSHSDWEEKRTYLPPAAYSWVQQSGGRGVYSFCMCPGGIIAACATGPGEVVTNGWSPSKRNNPFANSGIVVSVGHEDFVPYASEGPLAGLRFQEIIERKAYAAGGGSLVAPAQRLVDFVAGKVSETLPQCSYQPGIVSADLQTIFPQGISMALREALGNQIKKWKGYNHPDAVLVATESRTSTPVRIPRTQDGLHHPGCNNLYPAGEGAGYAGGIVSAAMDGWVIADSIIKN